MNYLLVNHIAAHAGVAADRIVLPPAWARDLSASARAAAATGVELRVATPLASSAAPADAVEVVPADQGFRHIALPHYESARSFLQQRANLALQLQSVMAAADVVQLDVGGHPMPLGLFADPIARTSMKPTLWMLAGDELPDLQPGGESASATKRIVGRTLGGRVRRLLSDALRNASAVITTHPETTAELARRYGADATMIESVDVTDDELADTHQIGARHARLLDTSRPVRLMMPAAQTIDRGTDHILAAMHRCWRLRVPVTLVASSKGSEADAIRRHARELGLEDVVSLQNAPTVADADVVIDAALSNAMRLDHESFIASGLPVIAYAPRRTSPGVTAIARGAVDLLADAIFQIGTNRAQLASQMVSGHAWVRERTIDAAHRRRFSVAMPLVQRIARGAA